MVVVVVVGRHWQSNVPLLTVSGELTRFRARDRVRDNGTTLEATVSGHLNLTPIPVTRAVFSRFPPSTSLSSKNLQFFTTISFRVSIIAPFLLRGSFTRAIHRRNSPVPADASPLH